MPTDAEHRHACEVRYVAAMPTDEDRAAFLALVRKHRGEEAYRRLRGDAWVEVRNNAKGEPGAGS